MSFCAHCGANVAAGARYCAACGRLVAAAPDAPAVQPPSAAPPSYAAPYTEREAPPYALPPREQPGSTQPTYAYSPQPQSAYAYPPQPAPAMPAPQPKVTQGMALAALLLNILIWPGLGSLVAGVQKGWAQGFLCLGGVILTVTVVGLVLGIPMIVGAYIWGIVTGVNLLQGGEG